MPELDDESRWAAAERRARSTLGTLTLHRRLVRALTVGVGIGVPVLFVLGWGASDFVLPDPLDIGAGSVALPLISFLVLIGPHLVPGSPLLLLRGLTPEEGRAVGRQFRSGGPVDARSRVLVQVMAARMRFVTPFVVGPAIVAAAILVQLAVFAARHANELSAPVIGLTVDGRTPAGIGPMLQVVSFAVVGAGTLAYLGAVAAIVVLGVFYARIARRARALSELLATT